MGSSSLKRKERKKSREIKQLKLALKQGKILATSSDAPNRPGILQTVTLKLMSDDRIRVQVEHYYPGDWDRILGETENYFNDLNTALEWIETYCQLQLFQFHDPSDKSINKD